jgi:hypothetical protein
MAIMEWLEASVNAAEIHLSLIPSLARPCSNDPMIREFDRSSRLLKNLVLERFS